MQAKHLLVSYCQILQYYSLYDSLLGLHGEITVIDPNVCEVYSGGCQDLEGLRIVLLKLVCYMKSIDDFTLPSSGSLFYTVQ